MRFMMYVLCSHLPSWPWWWQHTGSCSPCKWSLRRSPHTVDFLPRAKRRSSRCRPQTPSSRPATSKNTNYQRSRTQLQRHKNGWHNLFQCLHLEEIHCQAFHSGDVNLWTQVMLKLRTFNSTVAVLELLIYCSAKINFYAVMTLFSRIVLFFRSWPFIKNVG